MPESGYTATQFLIVFPDVVIEGNHAPTQIALDSMGRKSNVLVTAHTAPAPVSTMARNLLTLFNFSIDGPASSARQPLWKETSKDLPDEAEGRVTIFEVLVRHEENDKAYDAEAESEVDWDDLSNPLVRASSAINLYLVALRIVFETRLSLLPQGHLQGPILHRMCRVKESPVNGIHSLSVRDPQDFMPGLGGTRAPEVDNEVSFDEDKVIELEVVLEDLKSGNRILAAKERMVAAHTSLHLYGDLTGACLEAATASEMFLDTALTMLFWESNVAESGHPENNLIVPTEDEVRPFKLDGSLTKRIKTDFNAKLGGNPWSVDDGTIGDWHKNCFGLRHRVIHGGYRPKYSECLKSIESASALISFVLKAISQKNTKYPRTAWLLLGENGLKKRNAYSNKYRKIFNEIVNEKGDWRKSYTNYRNEVSKQMI